LTTDKPWIPEGIEDTVYLARLKYYTKRKFTFYDCLEYAGLNDELIDSIDKKEEQKSDWSGPLSKKQLTYAACDVIYLERLYNDLKEHSQSSIYKLDIANLFFAIDYTRNGLPTNQVTVLKHKKDFTIKLEETLEKLPINPNSYKQSQEYLGVSSSSAEVLMMLINQGDAKAQLVKDARHYSKMLSFLQKYKRDVVRGFFQPCTALSGRFSCTGGDSFGHTNLQQVPEELQDCFEVSDDQSFIYKDFSGLELRMCVAYTGEETMAELMRSGADMHGETCKSIFKTDDFTKLQRDLAKYFNFGLIYGAGPLVLQQTILKGSGVLIPLQEVAELRKLWFEMYFYFAQWHKMFKDEFNVKGFVDVETALGRKVRCYKLTDALNTPIQGSSVEVQKTGLILLKTKYPEVHLADTIHDSNILISKKEDADMWGERLDECMIEAWNYVIEDLADPDIPMPTGYKTGPVWVW